MATTNPLERKARNSFIKGLVIAGAFGLIAIIALVIFIMQMRRAEEERVARLVKVYTLNQDVKAGQLITPDMLTLKDEIDPDTIPSNYVSEVGDYFLTDQDGNPVQSGVDTNGNVITYVTIDGENFQIEGLNEDTQTGTITTRDGVNRTVIVEGTPAMAKINMNKNTVLTTDSIARSFELTSDSTRKQEYNMISLPADIETDDVIDVRLRLPDGTDYIVVSKKRITILDEGGIPSVNTFTLNLTEDEILLMSNAIVESYMIDGSRLYVTRYVEPGLQTEATLTYVPNGEVQDLIGNRDPNVVAEEISELSNRLGTQGINRENINAELNKMQQEERDSKANSGVQQEISDAEAARQTYLDSLE